MSERLACVERIKGILENKKAECIEVFDVKDTDYFVDYVIIATALVDKHGLSLLDELKTQLKPEENFYHVDEENPHWIVADLGDIIIHLFTENQRKKFNLEEFLRKIQKGA